MTAITLQTLRAPTFPRPATLHRMQGVQRYPALFVAAPGPFLGRTDRGYRDTRWGDLVSGVGC